MYCDLFVFPLIRLFLHFKVKYWVFIEVHTVHDQVSMSFAIFSVQVNWNYCNIQ